MSNRFRCIPEWRNSAGVTLTYAEWVADGRPIIHRWLLIDLDECAIVFVAHTLEDCQTRRDALSS